MRVKYLLDDLKTRMMTPNSEQGMPDSHLLTLLTPPYRRAHNIAVKHGKYPEWRKFRISLVSGKELYRLPKDVMQVLMARRVNESIAYKLRWRRLQEKDLGRSDAVYNDTNAEVWLENGYLGYHPKPGATSAEAIEITYAPTAGNLVILDPFTKESTFGAAGSTLYYNSPYETFDADLSESSPYDSGGAWPYTDTNPKWHVYYVSSLYSLTQERTSNFFTYGIDGLKVNIPAQTASGTDNDYCFIVRLGDTTNRKIDGRMDFTDLTRKSCVFLHVHISSLDDFCYVDSGTPDAYAYGLNVYLDGTTNNLQYSFAHTEMDVGDNYFLIPMNKMGTFDNVFNEILINMPIYRTITTPFFVVMSKFAFYDSCLGFDMDQGTNNIGDRRPVEELRWPLGLAQEAIVCEAAYKALLAMGRVEQAKMYQEISLIEWDRYEKMLSSIPLNVQEPDVYRIP